MPQRWRKSSRTPASKPNKQDLTSDIIRNAEPPCTHIGATASPIHQGEIMRLPRLATSMCLLSTVMLSAVCLAQDYPTKPIHIVTSGAGDGNDLQSRLIAAGIAAPLGQQVIVENRPGTVPVETVAKAAP